MRRGCLVCVICNSNSFHSFIFKLGIMIVHTLKLCTSYFVHIWYIFSFFQVCWTWTFYPSEMLRGCLVCVICDSISFHSFIFKLNMLWLLTHWTCVHPILCAHPSEMLRGCLICVICDCSSFHSFIFKLNMLWLLTHWTCVHPIFCAHYIIFLGLLNLDIITSTPPLECLHCLFVCYLLFKQIWFLYIQTLHNDCSHI